MLRMAFTAASASAGFGAADVLPPAETGTVSWLICPELKKPRLASAWPAVTTSSSG